MITAAYRTSRPDPWTLPRAHRDASLRYHMHGPIQPMDQDRPAGFWRRLLLG